MLDLPLQAMTNGESSIQKIDSQGIANFLRKSRQKIRNGLETPITHLHHFIAVEPSTWLLYDWNQAILYVRGLPRASLNERILSM
jgi:hypothetical protein